MARQVLRDAMKGGARSRVTYVERVNLAIDYVISHLAEPLRLADVARVTGLSPFHVHRVFQALVGETLASFVKRLRLERALVAMAFEPRASLTAIAMKYGFSSSSDFSRSFKQRYGEAPSKFDLNAWRAAHATELEASIGIVAEGAHVDRLPTSPNPDGFTVSIRRIPARTVAYTRVLNPYRGDAVFRAVHRLIAWAERNSLAEGQWLGYQWENPEITALEDCQYHIAVVADRFTVGGEIGRFSFPPLTVAQVEVHGGVELELRALQWLYGSWLPTSGWVPDDHPGFEAFIGKPFAHGTEFFELHAQIPIRRA